MRLTAFTLGFSLVLLGVTSLASAQNAPDVVTTRDGGMVRGTISESVPQDHVTITLTTGEVRTIPWANVEYAGPESDRPSTAPAVAPPPPRDVPAPSPAYTAPARDPNTVRLQVLTEQSGLALHEVTGMATAAVWTGQAFGTVRAYSFHRLCGVPCTIDVPRGSHQFALSQGGDPVPARAIDILRDGTLATHYVDRGVLRAVGWITLVVGGLAGAAWMVVPLLTTDYSSDDWLVGLIGGAAVLSVSEIVGLILALQGDAAELRFD